MKKLLTPKDVGDRLGVNCDTARRYMRREMACIILPGGDIRVEEAEVERWTDQRRQAPAGTKSSRKKPVPRIVDLTLFEPDGRIKRRRKAQ